MSLGVRLLATIRWVSFVMKISDTIFIKGLWKYTFTCYTHFLDTHTHLRGEINVCLSDLSADSHPVQSVRTCWRIIYMFVCSPTSCLGVVNIDIDQNHQLWWSPPGSTINEVWTCQLNPGQREEDNVCINITASSQRGLGSGLTPGLTALPDHKAT